MYQSSLLVTVYTMLLTNFYLQDTTNEIAEDDGQDDEELDLAFASNSSFIKSWRGPVFIIAMLVLLVCLIGCYMSLWSNRMSAWPSLPGKYFA